MNGQRMTLLIGSPRKKGTSYSFARTIKKLAEARGSQVDMVFIIEYYDRQKALSDLKPVLAQSEIIGLVMPMYVDTLPAPVIWLLERLSSEYPEPLRGKKLFAVSQCGFPDVSLLQPSLESCRLFAQSSQMKWLGGIGYGGGAIIDGALMENLGKKGQKITSGFQMAIEDILQGKPIGPEVQKQLTVKIPTIAYWPLSVFLNYRSRQAAKKYGVKKLKGKVLLE